MTPSPTLHVITQLAELFNLLGVAVLVGGTFVTCGCAIDVGQVAGRPPAASPRPARPSAFDPLISP